MSLNLSRDGKCFHLVRAATLNCSVWHKTYKSVYSLIGVWFILNHIKKTCFPKPKSALTHCCAVLGFTGVLQTGQGFQEHTAQPRVRAGRSSASTASRHSLTIASPDLWPVFGKRCSFHCRNFGYLYFLYSLWVSQITASSEHPNLYPYIARHSLLLSHRI